MYDRKVNSTRTVPFGPNRPLKSLGCQKCLQALAHNGLSHRVTKKGLQPCTIPIVMLASTLYSIAGLGLEP